MMKTLDKYSVKQLSDAIMANLAPLETQFGVKIAYKGGRFSASNVTFKVEASIVGASGEVMSAEREAYKHSAFFYGLKPEWLNQSFSFAGNTYTIDGLKTRCHKSPVMVIRKDGKRFKMSARMVVDAFKLQTI